MANICPRIPSQILPQIVLPPVDLNLGDIRRQIAAEWLNWIGLSSVLHPRQHSIIGYMGDGFYRSKYPTNSIKVLKEQIVHRQSKHTICRHEHKTQQIP